jgi:hypothetical protein
LNTAKAIFTFFFTFTVLLRLHAQQLSVVSGTVFDSETSSPVPNATLIEHTTQKGTITDSNGNFQLKLVEGKYTLHVSLIGYEQLNIQIDIPLQTPLRLTLKPTSTTMGEIVVTDIRAQDKLTETETGLVSIDKKQLETMPYLLGEADPIRILQLMPGVQKAGEGNTGFYVRGGAVDQNMVLLDNSVVYNPSHLFGFFSVFNGSVVNSLDLYKGGIPSYYGGRLSSITRINTRRGNDNTFKAEGSLGLIATNLLLEGPIKKGKGSFIIAGRRTYADLFINPLRKMFSIKEQLNYYFFDLNLNADYRLGARDKLTLRSYSGKDNFHFGTGSSFTNAITWGNTTASLNWIHSFNEKVIGEFSVGTVLYNMDFAASINNYAFKVFSSIADKNLSYRFDIQHHKHNLTMGVTYVDHALRPNNVEASTENVDLKLSNNVRLYSDEAAVYVNDKYLVNDKLEINAGLRLSGFRQKGPFTRYVEDDNLEILDTITYSRHQTIAKYANIEPRLSIRYSLSSSSALKISYDRGYQYMHMAPLSSASLPLDVWVTSSTIVKPQSANQYSAGYFRNFLNNMFETSAVLYYKSMSRQLEYRDGVIIGYSKGFNYDDNFVFGKGTSYGAEFLIKKNIGKLNGLISYTLSRTTRKFPELNDGKKFPAKYDRLHDLSIMANYVKSSRWTFSAIFVYGTGNALNLPIARYVIQGNVVNEYGKRNSFRMPPYHRLDLAATCVVKKTKRFESAWIFSVYNVYNRRNPYYIYFETKGDLKEYKLQTNLKQVSLFPVIPAITYRFKF